MAEAGEVPAGGGRGRRATATPCACRSPTATFDRVVASEVMEHIPDDAGAAAELARVLRPGGTLAVTVPSWLPEQVCWALSDEYHAPFVPGGHVRIYTRGALPARLRDAGLRPGGRAPRPRPALALLVAASARSGPERRPPAGAGLPPAAGVGHRRADRSPPGCAERLLSPVLGKSLVVYAGSR